MRSVILLEFPELDNLSYIISAGLSGKLLVTKASQNHEET